MADGCQGNLKFDTDHFLPDTPMLKIFDVFISHASEDKDELARPLAEQLTKLGLEVWLDELAIKLGASVRRSVDDGIRNSQVGILLITKRFLEKKWTLSEADALISDMISKDRLLIPIWHGVTRKDVYEFSPILADRKAYPFTGDIVAAANAIYETMEDIRIASDVRIHALAKRLLHSNDALEGSVYSQCEFQIRRFFAYGECYWQMLNDTFPADFDSLSYERQRTIEEEAESQSTELKRQFDFPPATYLEGDIGVFEGDWQKDFRYCKDALASWVAGVLGPDESMELWSVLDEDLDVDAYLVLFGVPHLTLTRRQRRFLLSSVPLIGDSFNPDSDDSFSALEELCAEFLRTSEHELTQKELEH